MVYLASSANVAHTSGEFFFKCRPETLSADALDDNKARRLWRESEKTAASIS